METTNHKISEELAGELCEVLERSRKTTDKLIETTTSTFNQIIKISYAKLQLSQAELLLKVAKSSFITRWYWKRKLAKIESKLTAIRNDDEFISIINSD